MKNNIKEIPTRKWLASFLYLILIPAVILSTSCQNKKQLEELNQQLQDSQAQVKDLQKDVAAKEDAINRLNKEKAELQKQVPEIHNVLPGDNHWEIAYTFLTQKMGIPGEEARKILGNTFLFHPILEGFKIGNYFYRDIFGTFVTQGDAKVCPAALMRAEKKKIKKIEEEHIQMTKELEALKEKTEMLPAPPEKVVVQIDEFEEENKQLKSQVEELKKQVADVQSNVSDLESRLNSAYYFADTKSNLKAEGKIKPAFLGIFGLKIGEITFSDFQNRIDLREGNVIELNAADFQKTAIKKVRLFPKHMIEGIDYRVEIAGGGQSARIHLLKNDKFLLSRIMLAVY